MKVLQCYNNGTRITFQLYCTKNLVLYASRNQRAIVHKGPENLSAGLARVCTFQNEHIEQQNMYRTTKRVR